MEWHSGSQVLFPQMISTVFRLLISWWLWIVASDTHSRNLTTEMHPNNILWKATRNEFSVPSIICKLSRVEECEIKIQHFSVHNQSIYCPSGINWHWEIFQEIDCYPARNWQLEKCCQFPIFSDSPSAFQDGWRCSTTQEGSGVTGTTSGTSGDTASCNSNCTT